MFGLFEVARRLLWLVTNNEAGKEQEPAITRLLLLTIVVDNCRVAGQQALKTMSEMLQIAKSIKLVETIGHAWCVTSIASP